MKHVWGSIICLGTLLLSACGGGGTETAVPRSDSFFPLTAKYQYGQNVGGLSWSYSVNNNESVAVTFDDQALNASNIHISVDVDTRTLERNISQDATLSNGQDIDGSYSYYRKESYTDGASLVNLSRVSFSKTTEFYEGFDNNSFSVRGSSEFEPALPWFLNRNDLHELPIGHIDYQTTFATTNYTASTSQEGVVETRSETDATVYLSWEILNQLGRLTVNGEVFSDVVKVSLTTNLELTESQNHNVSTTIYWVARGIGIVKAKDVNGLVGDSEEISLDHTFLEQ